MEISNKFLAFLLVIAILVSVIASLYTVNRLHFITGYYSDSGLVNVTISSNASLNLTGGCAFGTGFVSGGSAALLESNGTAENWSGSGTDQGFLLENSGNENLTINVSSAENVTGFYNDSDCNQSYPYCNVTFWVTDKSGETGACGSGSQAYPGPEMDLSNQTVCTDLGVTASADEINISCRLAITDDIYAEEKTDTWTFWYFSV